MRKKQSKLKTVFLNGTEITTMADVHRVFAEELNFPGTYGNNLDALHDLLTEPREVIVLLRDQALLKEALGERYDVLMQVLHDAAEENPRLILLEEEDA